MKKWTGNDRIRFFRKLPPDIIRQRDFLQFTDEQLLETAHEFGDRGDASRYVALLESLLHSPEHSPELVDYGAVYEELMDATTRIRSVQDALATGLAYFAYTAQHEEAGFILEPAERVITLYLRGDAARVEKGLRILVRFARAFSPPMDWVAGVLVKMLQFSESAELGEKITQALRQQLQGQDSVRDQREGAASQKSSMELPPEINPQVINDLQDALVQLPLPLRDKEALPTLTFSLQPPLDALAQGEADEAWIDAHAPQAELLALELIYLALSPEMALHPAADGAVQALRRWQEMEAAPWQELAPWLEKARGNWRIFLTHRIGKVGLLTPDELKTLALDDDVNVLLREDAVDALIEIAQRAPEIREDVVTLARHLLTRPESRERPEEETLTAGVIVGVVKAGWKALLPEIEDAFRDDVVEPLGLLPRDIEQKWGVRMDVPDPAPPRSGGEYLPLRCKRCGRTRLHFVRRVLLDEGTMDKVIVDQPVKYSPFVMDHEIVCPKCGARDDYEVDVLQKIQLVALAYPDMKLSTDDVEPIPALIYQTLISLGSEIQVYPTRFAGMDKSEVHPLELRDRYLQRIRQNPQNPDNYVALANIYKNLFRDDQALEAMRQAYELAPRRPDIMLRLAMAEHDAGDRTVARRLYSRIIDEADSYRPRALGGRDIQVLQTARAGLMALRKGEPSPWIPASLAAKKERKQSRRSRPPSRRKRKKKKRKRR